MVVFLIAHAKVEKFEDPEASAYDRYSPRLHKHAAALVTEWCDAVLFATRKIPHADRRRRLQPQADHRARRSARTAANASCGRSAARPAWPRTATASPEDCRCRGTR